MYIPYIYKTATSCFSYSIFCLISRYAKIFIFSQRYLWIFFDLHHVRAVLKYCLGRSRCKYKFTFCCLTGQGVGRNNGSLLGFSFTPLFVHFSHKGLSLFTKTWLLGFCFHVCAYTFLIWLRLYTFFIFLCCYGGFLLFKNKENKAIVFEVIIIVLLGEEKESNDYRAT